MTAAAILDAEYLPVRAKLLEIAATLDRLDRAEASLGREPRVARIREAVEMLNGLKGDRAEQIQLLFSREYDDDWATKLGMPR